MEQQKADRYKFYGTLATAITAIATAAVGWYDSSGKVETSKEKSKSGYEVLVHQAKVAEEERAKLEEVVYTLQGRLDSLERLAHRVTPLSIPDEPEPAEESEDPEYGSAGPLPVPPPPPPVSAPSPKAKPAAKAKPPADHQQMAAMPDWEEL